MSIWFTTRGPTRIGIEGMVEAAAGSSSTWWLTGKRLIAAFVMNRPDEERETAPRWIAEQTSVDADRLRAGDSLSGMEPNTLSRPS